MQDFTVGADIIRPRIVNGFQGRCGHRPLHGNGLSVCTDTAGASPCPAQNNSELRIPNSELKSCLAETRQL